MSILSYFILATLTARAVSGLPLEKRQSGSQGVMSNTTNPAVSPALYSQLLLAEGVVDRFTILANQNNSDFFKFNYNPDAVASHVSIGQGGQGNLANSKSFPTLIGLGVAMSMGFVREFHYYGIYGPMNISNFDIDEPMRNQFSACTPSSYWSVVCIVSHRQILTFGERFSEFLNVVSGGPLKTGFILENGLPEQISTVLSLYEAAILPQGSIHYEVCSQTLQLLLPIA